MSHFIVEPELWDLCESFFHLPSSEVRRKLEENGSHFGFSIEPKGRIAYFQKNYRGEVHDLTKRMLLKTGKFCRFLDEEIDNERIKLFGEKIMQQNGLQDLEIRITPDVGDIYEREHPEDESELGNSCMREKPYNYILNGACKCAYMEDEEGNLIARALLWHLPCETYLDRIYAVNNAVKKIMSQWGENNGYILYDRNSPAEALRHSYTLEEMSARVDWTGDEHTPYMDTFRFAYMGHDENMYLAPDLPDYKEYGIYAVWNETDGTYQLYHHNGYRVRYDEFSDMGKYICNDCADKYDKELEAFSTNDIGFELCPNCMENQLIESYTNTGKFLLKEWSDTIIIHTSFGVFGIESYELDKFLGIKTCPDCDTVNLDTDYCFKCGKFIVQLESENWEYTATYEKVGRRSYGRNQRRM